MGYLQGICFIVQCIFGLELLMACMEGVSVGVCYCNFPSSSRTVQFGVFGGTVVFVMYVLLLVCGAHVWPMLRSRVCFSEFPSSC